MTLPVETLDALAKALHWWRCYCGEWPCTEAEDGAYLEDAKAVVTWLAQDGYTVTRITEPAP